MPKRKGYILEKIADMDNLRAADREAQSGKVTKNRFIRMHNENAEDDLIKLREMILNLDFPPPEYTKMTVVSDGGKKRDIIKQAYFPWRILHHAILRVIGEDINKNLINDTCACIKGKGLHFGVNRMKMFLRRYPEYKWFVKIDIRKYYQSIPHDVIIKTLRHKYKDEKFIELIKIALLSYESGQEIIKCLQEDEEKKRNTNWGVYESAIR